VRGRGENPRLRGAEREMINGERGRLANSIGVTQRSASCAPGRARGGIIDRPFPEGRGRRVIRRRSPRNGVISTWVSIVSTRHGIARPARRVLPAIEKLTVGNASQRIHPSWPPPSPLLSFPPRRSSGTSSFRSPFVRNCGLSRPSPRSRVHVPRGWTGRVLQPTRGGRGRSRGARRKRMSSRDGSRDKVAGSHEGHRRAIRKVNWSGERHLIELRFNLENFAAGITERLSRVVTDSGAEVARARRIDIRIGVIKC